MLYKNGTISIVRTGRSPHKQQPVTVILPTDGGRQKAGLPPDGLSSCLTTIPEPISVWKQKTINSKEEIIVMNYTPGVYFLHIFAGSKDTVYKIIVQ